MAETLPWLRAEPTVAKLPRNARSIVDNTSFTIRHLVLMGMQRARGIQGGEAPLGYTSVQPLEFQNLDFKVHEKCQV